MLEVATLVATAEKAAKALVDNKINHAYNENAQTFMVHSKDAETAERILVDQVSINGVTVVASPGRAWSVFTLTVPLNVQSNVPVNVVF